MSRSRFVEVAGQSFALGQHAYALVGGGMHRLTLHPKTGRLVRESDVRWPEDYPPQEVANNLRSWYGPEARARAVALGTWEAAMLLEERRPKL